MSSKKRIKRILPRIRPHRNKRKKPGSAPGTIQHVGERHLEKIHITVHDYDQEKVQEIPIDEIKESKQYLDDPSNTWIKIRGLHEIEKLQSIWFYFDLHPLIQEDIVSTSQRPKMETYDNCIYFVLRMLTFSSEDQALKSEQISIVLGKNYVLSFQETDQDYFKPILDRLQLAESRLRKLGPDYLTYALIDCIVDHYFSALDVLADEMENLEDKLLIDPDDNILHNVHRLRRETIFFRKSVWPLRDAMNSAIRDESKFIESKTKIYLRDVYDHVVQVIDNIENYRDMILGMHDMYMSTVSNRMNEVMKVLTIIATIFIPLTFIAGVYGMNFDPEASPFNMPELNWYWGYPASLLAMLLVAGVMIGYFKRKNWL